MEDAGSARKPGRRGLPCGAEAPHTRCHLLLGRTEGAGSLARRGAGEEDPAPGLKAGACAGPQFTGTFRKGPCRPRLVLNVHRGLTPQKASVASHKLPRKKTHPTQHVWRACWEFKVTPGK